MTNSKDEVNVQKLYGKECTLSKEDFLKNFKVTENGLSKKQAQENLNKYGNNEITQQSLKGGTITF